MPRAGVTPSIGDEGDPMVPQSFAMQGSRSRAGYIHKPAERGCVRASVLGLMPQLSRRSFMSLQGQSSVLGTPIPARPSLLPCF